MSLIRLENVTKRFAGEPILDGIAFRVEEGDKIGLIGRNGSGKSTLFRLMTGEIEPDQGTIERMRRARIACLAQLPNIDPAATLHHVVMDLFKDLIDLEHELRRFEERIAAGDHAAMDRYSALQDEFQVRGGYQFRAKAKRVLGGLGFSESEFSLPVSALSGGQRTRLMLALVLLEDADLLLLDEPENHLDIGARQWLEAFLKDWPRAFVVISHDRQLLNAAVRRVVEVERGALAGFTGTYDDYAGHKALLRQQQEEAFDRQQEFIAKEQRWIERFRYKSTKARQVQSRIKRLEKLERVDAPPPDASSARFSLGGVVRSGQVVLDASGLSKAYGDLCLYHDLDLQIERGERIGIVGPNGSGKTTLLRHLAGRLPDAAGVARPGHKVELGFYEQHHESVNAAVDVFTEIRNTRPDMLPEEVRSFMARFLFTGEDVFKPIAALSGGELSRVAIAKLILGGANVLLLDEPTNHLDIASREALEEALAAYPGTIILVTHDRALIDRLVTRLVVIENGAASVHLGNYADYVRALQNRAAQASPAAPPEEAAANDIMRIRRRKADKGKRPKDRERLNRQRKRRQALEQLEEDIAALEETIVALEHQFPCLDPDDFERARTLKAEYEGMKGDLAEMYAEWERLADEMSTE
ncbi:MAG: ABC-F family ATP-binding cassette domain-containing protein [Candidatus Hydrogenedentes bacterium]|nr:ABC-F family ATP-binding cassette domain-containing protein [Candidatus Hydrogenedentota bacterium]